MQYHDPSSPLPLPKASGDNALDRLFGASPHPASAQAANAMQKTFQERVPQYATNPIVGAAVGAVAAVIACIVLVFVFTLIVHAVGDQAISQAAGSGAPYIQQIINSSLLAIVALAHHASLTVTGATFGASVSGTIDLPLTLLLLIPAASLMLGGYISAATDYSNQLRFVLLRAAAIGPIYGILMTLIVALFGAQQIGTNSFGSTSASLGASFPSMLLYGIVWGMLFGSLGGLIKLFGRYWRAGTVAYLLSRPRSTIVAGITGALASVGIGLLLCMPLIFFAIGFSVTQGQFHNSLSLSSTNTTPIGLLIVGLSLLSLPAAIWIFAFGSGASISANLFTSASFTSTPTTQNDVSLFHLPAGQQYLLLIMLIPAIAYFVGGRVSARVLGVANQQKQGGAGAIMGVVSSIIMFLVAIAGGVGFNASGTALAGLFGGTGTGNVGPNLGSSFLGSLIFGVIFGALGGYLYRFPQPKVQRASHNPLLQLYDRLTQQPRGVPRQAARVWLYTGVTVCFLLGIIAIAVGIIGGTLLNTLPYSSLQTDISILGGLLLGLPLLCFVIALMADTAATPPGSEVLVHRVAQPMPMSSPMATPSYPAPSSPYPGQYPSAPYAGPPSFYPPATGPYPNQQPTPEIYPGQQPSYPPATGPFPRQQVPYMPTGPYPGAQPAYPPAQYPAPQSPAYPPSVPYPAPQPQYPYPAQPQPSPQQNAAPPAPQPPPSDATDSSL